MNAVALEIIAALAALGVLTIAAYAIMKRKVAP